MLTGQQVSAGFIDRANARLAERLTEAGFATALHTALLAEPVLAADETPVEVVTPAVEEDTGQPAGAPHVLVIRTPDKRLVLLTAMGSRRYEEVIAALRTFTGYLIVDGFGAYQRLLPDPDPGAGAGAGRVAPGGLLAGSSSAASTCSAAASPWPSSAPAACSPGPRRSSRCCARPTPTSRPPNRPAGPPWTPTCWPGCATATTPP
jgi:hypothetical protein